MGSVLPALEKQTGSHTKQATWPNQLISVAHVYLYTYSFAGLWKMRHTQLVICPFSTLWRLRVVDQVFPQTKHTNAV